MNIVLSASGSAWFAQSTYAEKDALKAAGWWWHGCDRRPCRACTAGVPVRVWWTADPVKAEVLRAHADEAARAAMDGKVAEHREAVAASRATDAAVEVPAPEGLAYLPFQRAGIAYASARPGALLGDEMGLGKTIQAVGVINADPTVRRVLVVCPASLKLNWKRELERWLVRPATIGIASGSLWPEGEVVIINYDILSKHRAAVDAVQWDLLVVDEAHYMKNPEAQRTILVLGRDARRGKEAAPAIRARRRLFLTGTPIVNRPVELWPLIHSLDPAGWPSFWAYAQRYCGARQNGYGWDFSGASHLEELQDKLRSTILIRRLKADVLTELPAKRRQVVEIAANGAAGAIRREREAWARIERDVEAAAAAAELAKAGTDEEYAEAVRRLQDTTRAAFTEIAALRHETAVAKIPAVIEHLRCVLDGGAKVVVFAHHHDVVDALAAEFGAECVKLDGRDAPAARQAAVDRFQSDPACRLFVGSIAAAGVGLTLTAAAHVVFAELDWTPGNVTQAEDRCHRIGQRESVLVQHLVLEESLDARMAHVLVGKQAVIDAALDRGADIIDVLSAPVLPLLAQAATASTRRKALDEEAAKLSPEMVAAVHEGLRILASMDADHATEDNRIGFNKVDTFIGCELAACDALTPRQAALGLRIVRKYHRQLHAELLDRLGR